MKRKILSILLAALMLCSLLPVTALADADPTAGTDTENYVTLELRFGESVSEIDQAAAKAVYEGKNMNPLLLQMRPIWPCLESIGQKNREQQATESPDII